MFNYNSFRGINLAAQSLKQLLVLFDTITNGDLRRKGVFLVAHSMGGLVARSFALDEEARAFVRGIAMLGTPNNGAITRLNRSVLEQVIEYGEHLSGVMPAARTLGCLSARQLTKVDADDDGPYIDQLNNKWASAPSPVPTLSISGGRRWLEVGQSLLANQLFNMAVQTAIGNEDNDGLVAERSVDLRQCLSSEPGTNYSHFNSYPDYANLNHTNLVQNQLLALMVTAWIRGIQPTSPTPIAP